MTETEVQERVTSVGGFERVKRRSRLFLKHENFPLIIVLVALIAIMSKASGGLTTRRVNMLNILMQSSTVGVSAIGQGFVILTGGIDLSVGGIGLLASVMGASMLTQTIWANIVGHSVSTPFALAVMLGLGIGFGAFNGVMVSRVGIPALIVTLGLWQICRGIGFQVTEGRSVFTLNPTFAFFGQGHVGAVPIAAIIFIVVAVIAYFVLNHTTYGRSIYATGGNPVSAWLSGIKVRNILFSVYVISGFLASLAGVIMTSRVMSASLDSLKGLEMDSIAAVVIGGVSLMGGKGTLVGVVLGVLILGVINNGMSVLGADPAFQGIVKGIIIIAAVTIDYVRRGRAAT
ncbi:MAG: ABC transporter permease [Dehalococcoidales bacterium]|nr:ABC transporter permease [Dehalococcoidales bacterium]